MVNSIGAIQDAPAQSPWLALSHPLKLHRSLDFPIHLVFPLFWAFSTVQMLGPR